MKDLKIGFSHDLEKALPHNQFNFFETDNRNMFYG